jgi:hypothetical protein
MQIKIDLKLKVIITYYVNLIQDVIEGNCNSNSFFIYVILRVGLELSILVSCVILKY